MRILLLGATGQIGWELMRALQPLGEIAPATRRAGRQGLLPADLASPDDLRKLIREIRPALIVNAAAYTAVDRAEEEAELATAVNAVAPGVIAEEAKACNAALIHYSTDYVFDGHSTEPYREDDEPNPLSMYGRSKLEGERAIAATGEAYLTLRTSWIYGTRGHNFLLTVRRLARERETLRVVDDQVGAPTWSRLVADATAQIIAHGRSEVFGYIKERAGLYHMSSAGQTSWFGFAETIASSMKAEGGGPVAEVVPIATADYPQPAKRPAWSVLDNSRLTGTFGIRLPDWRVGARLVFEELH